MTPAAPSTSASAARCSSAADAVDDGLLGKSSLATWRHRRREPSSSWSAAHSGCEAPEHVRRADHVAGVGQPLGRRPDVRADAEDLLDQQQRRGHARPPGARRRGHAGVVDGRPFSRAHRSCSRIAAHSVVRNLGRRAAGRSRLRPAARAHRPAPDRATRRRPAARRPRCRDRPPHRHVRDLPCCCDPATCSSSTTPGCSRPGCGCGGPPAGGRGAAARAASMATPVGGTRAPGPPVARRRATRRRRRGSRGRAVGRRHRPATRSGRALADDPLRPPRHRRDPPAALPARAAGRSRALPDRLRPSARFGRGADRRTAPDRRTAAPRSPTRGVDRRPRRARRRPGHVPAGQRRTTRSTHRMHSERYRVPPRRWRALPRRPAGRRRRHDERCGRWSPPPPPASSAGRTELFLHRRPADRRSSTCC